MLKKQLHSEDKWHNSSLVGNPEIRVKVLVNALTGKVGTGLNFPIESTGLV
jgi:hypothetical protein